MTYHGVIYCREPNKVSRSISHFILGTTEKVTSDCQEAVAGRHQEEGQQHHHQQLGEQGNWLSRAVPKELFYVSNLYSFESALYAINYVEY